MNRYTHIFVFLFIIFCFLAVFAISGCASGGPTGTGDSGTTVLRITLSVPDNAEIDTSGAGYYAILFNNFAEDIEVTNRETFTDFIRYDGSNFTWFHRQGNVPSPGYTWTSAGNLNDNAIIAGDGRSIVIRFDMNDDTNIFNQFITTPTFTTHVLTTDRTSSLLGRAIDTMGQGPSIGGNILYTVRFDRLTGIDTPTPPGFPFDALEDWVSHPDLGNFPYDSYDIDSFNLELEQE